MAMAWIKIKATTKTGDAGKVEKWGPKGRTIEYEVWGPVGDADDGDTFLKNFVEEYGENIAGKVLRKQWVVQAQALPRRHMEKGISDERIRQAMRSWKLDLPGRRTAKEVEAQLLDSFLSRWEAAKTDEEKLALHRELLQRRNELMTETSEEEENGNGDEGGEGGDITGEVITPDNPSDPELVGGAAEETPAPEETPAQEGRIRRRN